MRGWPRSAYAEDDDDKRKDHPVTVEISSEVNPIFDYWHPTPRYERWAESVGIPIYRSYFVDDLRTLELGPWDERECNCAIMILAGQEGVTESRVTEIPPGATLPPLKFSIDEIVYVLQGRGLTTVSADGGEPKRTFEWQTHSMFQLPRGYTHQFSNVQGHEPARLLNFNYLPLAMSVIPDPHFFFNNPLLQPDRRVLDSTDVPPYSEAKFIDHGPTRGSFWVGNFFPDLRAWDKIRPMKRRGAGGSSATLVFPGTGTRIGLPTMPVGTYKKAHQHGPGIVIVIPGGEGFSVMWPEGEEKKFIPWHEGSVFVPPNRWFHQHFNVGATPARYITMHPPRHPLFGSSFGFGNKEEMERNERQIEYPDEDPAIRKYFEAELAKRGVTTRMPEEAYKDPNYEWSYPADQAGQGEH